MSDQPKPSVKQLGRPANASSTPDQARPSSGSPAGNPLPAAGAASPDLPKNRGRDWLAGRLKALEHAQTQYVLTAGLILRHHVDARQLGLAPGMVRAPQHLLAHLERSREDFTWVRAEIEQYAGRMRTERPSTSPDPPSAPLPIPEPAAVLSRSGQTPRPPQPPGMSKTQPLGTGAPTYLKQGQVAPSPLRHPTTLLPKASGDSAVPVRHQAVSAPGSSLDVLAAAKSPDSGPSSQGSPAVANKSPAQFKQASLAPPAKQTPQPSPPKSTPTATNPISPDATKARPKPKPRLAHPTAGVSPLAASPSAAGVDQANPSAAPPASTSRPPQAVKVPSIGTSAPAATVTPVAPAPAAVPPPPPAMKLPMPQPSDFLPGGSSGPPSTQQQQQQPFMNAATGQQLTAADVEGMTSEEAQRILDSFQQSASQPAFGAFSADGASFAAGAAATAPPVPGAATDLPMASSAYPAPPPGGQDLAFDPAMLGELDLSLMGDLFGTADGSAGIDWDEVMKGVSGADGQQLQ